MPDEPSTGELARRLEDIRQDLKDDVRDLNGRLGEKVSQESYDLRHTALVTRVTALEEALREREKQRQADARERERQRQADRRLVLTGLVVPVLLVLLQVYLASRGASS